MDVPELNRRLQLHYKRVTALRNKARAKGEIFDSIEQLVCPSHPDAKFIVISHIPDSMRYMSARDLYNLGQIDDPKAWLNKLYACEGCLHERVEKPLKAYECRSGLAGKCGIVTGIPLIKTEKKMVYPDTRFQSNAKPYLLTTDEYSCRICKSPLGDKLSNDGLNMKENLFRAKRRPPRDDLLIGSHR